MQSDPNENNAVQNFLNSAYINYDKGLETNAMLIQSVFDAGLVGIYVLQAVRDQDGKITDFKILMVNSELIKVAKRNDLIGKLYVQEYPGVINTGIFDEMVKVVEHGKPGQLEYHYPYEGFDHWFLSTFVKFEDGIVATNLNITNFKAIEEDKLKNLLLLQQSEQLAKIGSWENEIGSNNFVGSDGFYKIFEIKPGTILKPELFLKYVNTRYLVTAERIVDYIRTGKADFESTIEFLVGAKIKTVKIKSSVFYDNEGVPQKILGVILDLSAIKKAEEQIKEDEVFIKGVSYAAPDMVYVIDINTIEMVYANNHIVKFFDKTEEEIRQSGENFFNKYVHKKDKINFYKSISELKEAGDNDVRELVYRLYDSNKKIHWVKTRRTVFKRDLDGIPTHVIGISQDVTEEVNLRKKNELLLSERRNLQSRKRKEMFKITLRTQEEERRRIAESLHNGLGQILYGVKLSLEQIDLSSQTAVEQNIEQLRQTTKLLELAMEDTRRISHELMPAALEEFGLKAAIEDVCINLNGSKGMLITCEFENYEDNLISMDYNIAVYRIVQELVLNIVKHSNAKHANVMLKFVKADFILEVNDDGVGINISNLKGDGIGLKSVRSKVKLLNGKIKINSAKGKGTNIKINIPVELL